METNMLKNNENTAANIVLMRGENLNLKWQQIAIEETCLESQSNLISR